jgi:hypothetical protein
MAFGDLTSLADVKAWLQTGQNAFPPTDDALLSRLITAASQFIQTWISRDLLLQDWLELRDGVGGQRLQFGAFPVSAVLSLTIDGETIPPAPSATAAGYVFSPTQLALRGWHFRRGTQNVSVTYTAGFAAPPPELAQACVELVALRYRERSRVGEVSRSIGGAETVAYSQKDMSDAIKTILSQYRLVTPINGFLTAASTRTDPATLVAAA